MNVWLQVVLTAFLTAGLVSVFVYFFFHSQVKPFLDNKVEDFRQISREMEDNIREGVRKGVNDSFRELPSNTVKETTRSVVKMGSGLVEGGISSIFKDKKDI